VFCLLPWKTIGERTIFSSVLRKGGSIGKQEVAWVACISSSKIWSFFRNKSCALVDADKEDGEHVDKCGNKKRSAMTDLKLHFGWCIFLALLNVVSRKNLKINIYKLLLLIWVFRYRMSLINPDGKLHKVTLTLSFHPWLQDHFKKI